MRSSLAFIALLAAIPLSAQGNASVQRRSPETGSAAMATYQPPAYRPIRAGDLRASGFLTEMRKMPFGSFLGPVAPQLVHSAQTPEVVFPGTEVAVQPPAGTSYRRGDTVMIAIVMPAPRGWGEVVIPTGLARIGEQNPRQTLATVIEMYGPIRAGQVILPAEPVTNPGEVQPVAIAGPSGEIITSREERDVSQAGQVLFASIGRAAGMRVGDFVELRRRPGPRLNGADTIDDVMAVAQVVHVDEKSSTIKLTRVIDPGLRPGTPVVRILTLPN